MKNRFRTAADCYRLPYTPFSSSQANSPDVCKVLNISLGLFVIMMVSRSAAVSCESGPARERVISSSWFFSHSLPATWEATKATISLISPQCSRK